MNTDSQPQTSVIIAVYNDPEGISTTVRSVLNQTCDPDSFEVLVVDNGSTDQTPETVAALARSHDNVFALSESAIQSAYAARNRGIEAARGEILAFLDADMWVPDDWIERITTTLSTIDCAYFGCNVEVTSHTTPPTAAAQYNMFNSFPVETYIEQSNFVPTCCLVTYAWVFETVGLFDETMISSGDKEFGQRVHRHGIEQSFVPDITVYHPARESIVDLCRKAYRIGRGTAQLKRRSKRTLQDDSDDGSRGSMSDSGLLGRLLPVYPLEFYIRNRGEIDVATSRLLVFDCIYQLQFICQVVGRLDESRREQM